jgi:hypothetical protein
MIGPLLIAVKITFQQIGEKEEPEDGKHDEKFYNDDSPKFPAPGHLSESIRIEIENFLEH